MNKKTLYAGAVIFLALAFAACDMAGPEPLRGSGGKAAVQVIIGSGPGSRTVAPDAALAETDWQLLGGKAGAEEILVAEFSGEDEATVYLDAGTWSFTLEGYKDGGLVLTGSIAEQAIGLEETNTLVFTVAPVLAGEGTVSITIALPPGSGITEARIFKDGTEITPPVTPVNNQIVLAQPSYPAGDYYFSVRLYKGNDLYGVVSEVVQVRANLASVETYDLSWADLNRKYTVTFYPGEGSVNPSSITVNEGGCAEILPTPTRSGYTFDGWFTSSYYEDEFQFTTDTPVDGDITIYAKWLEGIVHLKEEGVYIGIISFAGNATDLTGGVPVFLDDQGKDSLTSTVNSGYTIATQIGTAAFYAVHKALANLTSISTYPENLDSVNVITFTDGIDTGSGGRSKLNPIENLSFDKPEYAAYVDNQIDTRTIGGKPITAYSVGVRGSDVEDIPQFQLDLKQMASYGKDKELTDMSELEATFETIAGSLQTEESNTNFNLTTTLLSNGDKVRLTFEPEEGLAADVNSSRFIQGTISSTGIGANLTYVLYNITYGGGLGSIEGEGPITGTIVPDDPDDPNDSEIVKFAFTGMIGYNPGYDGAFNPVDEKPLHAKQYFQDAGSSTWRLNSEYKIGDATKVETVKRSVLIYLVLDASTSLKDDKAGIDYTNQVRDAAIKFINLVYEKAQASGTPE